MLYKRCVNVSMKFQRFYTVSPVFLPLTLSVAALCWSVRVLLSRDQMLPASSGDVSVGARGGTGRWWCDSYRWLLWICAWARRLIFCRETNTSETRSTGLYLLMWDALPWSLVCRWGRSWWRKARETTRKWCWWCAAWNPEKHRDQNRAPHTQTLRRKVSLTGSPGVQWSFLLTSTPERVLYMITDDTNTERIKEPNTFNTKRYVSQHAAGERILLMMLASVQMPTLSRVQNMALLWTCGCMRYDSSAWTKM